jgi:hypothetical protein
MRRAALLVPVALLAAACGARSNNPFTARATTGCLKHNDFTQVTTNPGRVGFIAGFAANGGIKATSPKGNSVTVAFAGDETAVPATEEAFRLHAPLTLRAHLADVMRSSRNAVIVWTTTPDSQDERTLEHCLAS